MYALIPCRGGSKRIPRKNIREFCGMPLIYWAIKQAQDSGVFDEIFVSTEDAEIGAIARSYGAIVIPQPMASDISTNVDVVRWVADKYLVDSIMLLQCTSPLRTPENIREAAGYMTESLVSVYSPIDGTYIQNGAIYAATTDFIRRTGRLYNDSSFLYLMGKENSVDIDEEIDWRIAEALMRSRLQ
jgi:CMP-N-acetylneuraminic acid synthetase